MSLMQVGIFAAIPLVADRQKLILKRLRCDAAPALAARRHRTSSMRLLIAARPDPDHRRRRGAAVRRRDRRVAGSDRRRSIILGSLTFIALGYVIASFAATEDAANGDDAARSSSR